MTMLALLASPLPLLLLLAACGGRRRGRRHRPRPPRSWPARGRGTVTIQVNPGDPNPPPPTSGPMQWTFEPMPQTNLQTVPHDRAVRARVADDDDHRDDRPDARQHAAGADQHARGVHSPRGCRGTFGSVGTAQATRIEADFTGTDCQQATFIGRLVLTKN